MDQAGKVARPVDDRRLDLFAVDILQSGVVTNTTTTDGQGRFSFNDLLVAAPAEVRASTALYMQQRRQLLIDFHLSMHEELFRLVHV